MQFTRDCHIYCPSDGFMKAEFHFLGETLKNWGYQSIMKIDVHVMVMGDTGSD